MSAAFKGEPRVRSAEFLAGAASHEQIPPPSGPEFVFAGRSNVGKSSLMNAIVGRKSLVRTSRTPGCTRQINFFSVEITAPSSRLVLVDLPGYGFAARSKVEREQWRKLIESYLTARESLEAVFVLVDVRRGLQEDDTLLLEFLSEVRPSLRVHVVLTKADKSTKAVANQLASTIARGTGLRAIVTSSTTREGSDRIWKTLLAERPTPDPDEEKNS